jgi:hypothetical protein
MTHGENILKLLQEAFEAGENRGYESSPIEPDKYINPDCNQWILDNTVFTQNDIDSLWKNQFRAEEIKRNK